MTKYRLIMSLLLDARSYRTIQAHCGAAHATIAKAKKTLDAHRITTQAQLDGYSDDELLALVGDGRMTVAGDFVTIDMDAVITARTGRTKTPLNVLWSTYLKVPAPQGLRHYSYERFRQLVGQVNICAYGSHTFVSLGASDGADESQQWCRPDPLPLPGELHGVASPSRRLFAAECTAALLLRTTLRLPLLAAHSGEGDVHASTG